MASFNSKFKNILLGGFFIFVGMLLFSILSMSFKSNSQDLKAGSLINSDNMTGAEGVQSAFRLVAKKVKPAVVNISSETIIRQARQFSKNDPFFQFFGNDFFDHFFNIPQEYKQKALGTGVIIGEDGYLLSNFHVVKNATKIIVTLPDGRKFKAKVIGTDPKTDLALLKIKAKNLPTAKLGDSDKVEVGDWAIAIGNPFGLNQTVTAGIISAKGRNKVGVEDYEDFLQTDASINPGNSGGPLLNIRGEVIGINTAIASPNGGSVGIGFAIPINMAKSIVPQLKKNGKVVRGWLGVYVQDLTEEIAKPLGMKPNSGVLVSDVSKDSPALKAGIEVGDVITEFDGKKIEDVDQLRKIVALSTIGKIYGIKVKRNNKIKNLKVKIKEMPSENVTSQEEEINKTWLGINVLPLTDSIKKQYHIDAEEKDGVIISKIENGSAAQESGLQVGDIILRINNLPIKTIKDYSKIINKYKDGVGSFLFLIKRHGVTIFIGLDNG